MSNTTGAFRSETVTVTVTPDLKSALERAVAAKKASGDNKASVNREAWERLRYTFDLTGEGDDETPPDDIAEFADKLAKGKARREASYIMRDAITMASKIRDFAYAQLAARGKPRSRLSLYGGVDPSSGILFGGPKNALAEYPLDDPYVPTEDISALRSENRSNIDKLTVETEAAVSDDDLRALQDLRSTEGDAVLKRLQSELLGRFPKASEYDSLAKPQQRRLLVRLSAECDCLKELEAVRILGRYGIKWKVILEAATEHYISALPKGATDEYGELAAQLAIVPAKQLHEAHDVFSKEVELAKEASAKMVEKLAAMLGSNPIE